MTFIYIYGHWKDWSWRWNSNTLTTSCEELTRWKSPWCWERLRAGREGDDRGWDGWMASPTQWTWVWVNSGSRWWTGRPGVLQSMGLQRIGHNWDTELNWMVIFWASQVMLVVKNPPANAGDARDVGSIPGSERSSGRGNGNPFQYSCLENPMDRGNWWDTVQGVVKNRTLLTWLSKHAHTVVIFNTVKLFFKVFHHFTFYQWDMNGKQH